MTSLQVRQTLKRVSLRLLKLVCHMSASKPHEDNQRFQRAASFQNKLLALL